ncbi:MAG: hypothetical protein IJ630_01725 [Treponema sp.]|nr:hypothetical protein [Treponema sp.]
MLQFRNESAVSKSIGLLSYSYAQSQDENGQISLKNTLQISFKGISFSADEVSPAKILVDNTEKNLTLVSITQETPLSVTFNFSDDESSLTSLTFSVSGTDSSAALSLNAKLPKNADGIYLNYKPTSGFSVTEATKTRLVLNSKNLTYAFTAAKIDDKKIYLSAKNSNSYYVAYDPSVEFSFSNLDSEMIIMQKSTYDANLSEVREMLVSQVRESLKTNQNLSEKSVVAYVAELAVQGRYNEAINSVPDSFKKGNKRTYLSAPYFNSLDSMYSTLEMHNQNLAEVLKNSLDSSSLSVFSLEDFADYINILGNTSEVSKILSLPDTLLENDSTAEQVKLSQASGILSTYLKLAALHSSLADKLLAAAQKSLKIIESCCTLTDSTLTLHEKDNTVSNYLALSTGISLVRWGEFNNAEEYSQAGYAIINSILSGSSLDTVTLADVYPILFTNPYYPHYRVLSRTSSETIWAWTCSPSISYSMRDNLATISLNFPKGETNYAFICGIAPFMEIEIYGLAFHSDPRFESYNSSGFIYKAPKHALLLKSRHKLENEIVRLSYRQSQKPAKPQPKAEEPRTEQAHAGEEQQSAPNGQTENVSTEQIQSSEEGN